MSIAGAIYELFAKIVREFGCLNWDFWDGWDVWDYTYPIHHFNPINPSSDVSCGECLNWDFWDEWDVWDKLFQIIGFFEEMTEFLGLG